MTTRRKLFRWAVHWLADVWFNTHFNVLELPYRSVELYDEDKIAKLFGHDDMLRLQTEWNINTEAYLPKAPNRIRTQNYRRRIVPELVDDVQRGLDVMVLEGPALPRNIRRAADDVPFQDQPGVHGQDPRRQAQQQGTPAHELDTLASKVWRQWGMEMFTFGSLKKGDNGSWMLLNDDLCKHATPDWFKDKDLRGLYEAAHVRVNVKQWSKVFENFFPKKGFQHTQNFQHYPQMEYWKMWIERVLTPYDEASVERIRKSFETEFNKLHWVPAAESDRIWRQRQRYADSTKCPDTHDGDKLPVLIVNKAIGIVPQMLSFGLDGPWVDALAARHAEVERIDGDE
jgi:hypothetical protein